MFDRADPPQMTHPPVMMTMVPFPIQVMLSLPNLDELQFHFPWQFQSIIQQELEIRKSLREQALIESN